MEIKLSKKHKFMWAAFVICTISVVSLSVITVGADGYTGWKSSVIEHIRLKTWWKNIGRSVEWNILKFIAQVIDDIEEGLSDIMSFNMQDLFQHVTGFTNTYPVAWITLTIFMIISAIALMIFDDKIKIKDTVRSILISALLITALPTLISSLDDLRSKGLADVDNISISSSDCSLGEDILSSNLIVLSKSAEEQKVVYYNSFSDYSRRSVYGLDINRVFSSQNVFSHKVESITGSDNYTVKYSTLDDTSKMMLLNIAGTYAYWKLQQIFYPWGHIYFSDGDGNTTYYCNSNHNDSQDGGYHCRYEVGVQSVERYLIECIADNPNVIAAGRSEFVKSRTSLSAALTEATPVLEKMNRIYIEPENLDGTYLQEPLLTKEQYEDLSIIEGIGQKILVGSGGEKIYTYDYDFLFTFIFLIVTVLSLFIAALKCGSLLFDILFTQIIAPVVIATEGTSSGRAKLIIKNLISSYLLFIIIALLLKVYVIAITYIHSQYSENNINYIVAIILIICFGKGVIDGPDIITRIMGIDAGLKSGVGTIMAVNSAMRMAGAAGKNITNATKAATHIAGTVAGGAAGAAGTIAGGIANGVKNFASGIPSNFTGAKNSVGSAIGNTDFGKKHPTAGKILSGAVGVANAATGGIAPSVKNAINNNPYNGTSRDDAISKATNTSPTDVIGKGLSSARQNIAKAGHSIANLAQNTAAGAKAGSQLSHGNFLGAKQTVMDRADSYSSASAVQSSDESFASQPASTAAQPQAQTQQSNTAPQPVTPSSPSSTAPQQTQTGNTKSNTASEPKTKI